MVLVRKSSEVQVSLCMTLEYDRNTRISYCVIALILKMRGSFLASDSAMAGDGAFLQVMAPLRPELDILEINTY